MAQHNFYIWARRFNQRHGKKRLPATIFLTDKTRLPDTEAIIEYLPRGSMVIIRDYDIPDRKDYVGRIVAVCRAKGHIVLVANDIALAQRYRADGVHFPEWNMAGARGCKSRFPHFMVSLASHSAKTLRYAEKYMLDLCLVSPVFKTLSHPASTSLGIVKLRQLQRSVTIPIYPLGGINSINILQLKTANIPGVAAIGVYQR